MKTVFLFVCSFASFGLTAQVNTRILTPTSPRPRHNLFRPTTGPYRLSGLPILLDACFR